MEIAQMIAAGGPIAIGTDAVMRRSLALRLVALVVARCSSAGPQSLIGSCSEPPEAALTGAGGLTLEPQARQGDRTPAAQSYWMSWYQRLGLRPHGPLAVTGCLPLVV